MGTATGKEPAEPAPAEGQAYKKVKRNMTAFMFFNNANRDRVSECCSGVPTPFVSPTRRRSIWTHT